MARVQSRTLTIADTHEFGQVYLHPEIAIFGFLEIGIHFVVPLFILIWVSARSDARAPRAAIRNHFYFASRGDRARARVQRSLVRFAEDDMPVHTICEYRDHDREARI